MMVNPSGSQDQNYYINIFLYTSLIPELTVSSDPLLEPEAVAMALVEVWLAALLLEGSSSASSLW